MTENIEDKIVRVLEELSLENYKTFDVNFYMFLMRIVMEIMGIIEQLYHHEAGVDKKTIAFRTGERLIQTFFPQHLNDYYNSVDLIIEMFISSYYTLKDLKAIKNCPCVPGCFPKK